MEKEKIAQAIDILKELDIDMWMVVEKESELLADPVMDFVIGTGVTWLSFFIFTKSGEKYAIVGNLDKEKIESLDLFDKVIPYTNSPKESLFEIIGEKNPSKIALNYSVDSPSADGLTYGKYLKLQSLFEGTDYMNRVVSAEELISRLRGRKSDEEIRRTEKAIDITLDIYDKVTEFVKPGMTEKEIAAFITSEREKLGLEPSWEAEMNPSVFTGPQDTGAHSGPTDRKVERGQVFNIDSGVIFEKYCSDLQRTWYVLKEGETEAPAVVMNGFDTIVKSIQLSFDAIKPGVKGIEIDTIARDYIVSRGYTEYPHALGHQVGRTAHDGSALLAPSWERYGKLPYLELEEGQIFTIEPRLYMKDHGVVTIEEMLVITAEGARWLSAPQKDIYLIR
ncbi:MAG: aminopeptidase P family protein [Candidatus Aminicenantes bacterium]|nr:aminopeptidase P family protein [Candidatus Aminicenantes bacterium]